MLEVAKRVVADLRSATDSTQECQLCAEKKMNRTAAILLLALYGFVAIGCNRDDQPANSEGDGPPGQSQLPQTERDAMEYTSAEVRILYGDLANRTKRIDDQREIQRLLSFFPGVGGGRKSASAAPWEPAVELLFTSAEGTVLRVTTDCDFWNERRGDGSELYLWSEGHGDWEVEPGLKKYIRNLFQENQKSEKQSEE